MRPRGLSSSSPSSTYVGQVAVQKPQWTHERRICSETAMSGSASWARVKLVCIWSSHAGVHAAGVEDAYRVERVLEAAAEHHYRLRLGLEYRHGETDVMGGAHQCGMAADARNRAAHRGHTRVPSATTGDPEQPAAPVV